MAFTFRKICISARKLFVITYEGQGNILGGACLEQTVEIHCAVVIVAVYFVLFNATYSHISDMKSCLRVSLI